MHSPLVNISNIEVQPAQNGTLIAVRTTLHVLRDSSVFDKFSNDGGAIAVYSTYPWAILPDISSYSVATTTAPQFAIPVTIASSTTLHSAAYNQTKRDRFPLMWSFDLVSSKIGKKFYLLEQQEPFLFQANGYPLPTFVITLRFYSSHKFADFNVTIAPYKFLVQHSTQSSLLSRIKRTTTYPLPTTETIAANNLNSKLERINKKIVLDKTFNYMLTSTFDATITATSITTNAFANPSSFSTLRSIVPGGPYFTILEAKVEKYHLFIPPFHLGERDTYKGEPVKFKLTIRNDGDEDAYSVYAQFHINSKSYSDFNLNLGPVFVTSLLRVGETKTVYFNFGPLINDGKHAFNAGAFTFIDVKVWNYKGTAIKTINQSFRIRPNPNKHVVFALVLIDDLWSIKAAQQDANHFPLRNLTVTEMYNAIHPRFLNDARLKIDLQFLRIESWDPSDDGRYLIRSVEELFDIAHSQAKDVLELPEKWAAKYYEYSNIDRTDKGHHGFDILIGITGITTTDHIGMADPRKDTAILAANSVKWPTNRDGQADEWLQHEISHLFGAEDYNGSEDVMDYKSPIGMFNWLFNTDSIRTWRQMSINDMRPDKYKGR